MMNLHKAGLVIAFFSVLILQSCGSTNMESFSTSEPITNNKETAEELPADATSGDLVEGRNPDLAEACINLAFESTGVDISINIPSSYEPSGADWHTRLKKVFSVHDNGYLFSMDKYGNDVSTWRIPADLEGVTIADPDSDFVYIGREYPAAILEFNIVTGTVTRTFLLGGANGFPESSSQGLEALTFVQIDGHPEGGEFWAGNQGNGNVYVYNLPIKTSTTSTTVELVTIHDPVPNRNDLSGMDYSSEFDIVYLVYDSSNRLVIADPDDATIYLDRSLPQRDQEGIAVNSLCDLFIAQDSYKLWFYKGNDEPIAINEELVGLLADRVVEVQNDDGSYDWKQSIDDPLTPETTGYQNVTGVSVWGLFSAIDLTENESYWNTIEDSVDYFDNRIDALLADPHSVREKLSCPNYTVLSWYLQDNADPVLEARVIDALNATLDARDIDFGDDETMRVDGFFNRMIDRRSSIPGIIPWDMGLCVEAFASMADISSDFEDDYIDSLIILADYIENDFLPVYDSDNTFLYGDISLSMPLFVFASSDFADSYTDLITGLTTRLEALVDEDGMITNGSENGDGVEQPSAYGLMALKQVNSSYVQIVQDYLESTIDDLGRIYDPETRQETYEVEGEVLRAISMNDNSL